MKFGHLSKQSSGARLLGSWFAVRAKDFDSEFHSSNWSLPMFSLLVPLLLQSVDQYILFASSDEKLLHISEYRMQCN